MFYYFLSNFVTNKLKFNCTHFLYDSLKHYFYHARHIRKKKPYDVVLDEKKKSLQISQTGQFHLTLSA